ncbi:MAG: type IV secretion protein Rhs, partial [bacterium]|nr:type IV secretion protein Rhs [bacterium]
YDSASRLTSASNPVGEDERYAYDEVGNRTSAGNAEGEIAHNANNELERYGDVEYEYDANGNMASVTLSGQVVFVYQYNADNRLVKVEGGNSNTIAEYYYDPFGRRLWKDVAGTRTYFFYSDEGLIAEYDGSGSEIRSYGYKPDSTWTTDPLWLKTGGQYFFYHNDHLGTPQKLMAKNGMVVWAATYSAFGEATIDTEHITNHLRFPG